MSPRKRCKHDRRRNLYRRGADRSWQLVPAEQCKLCGKILTSSASQQWRNVAQNAGG